MKELMPRFKVTARIERRTWWVNGEYLGDKSPFIPDEGETARELTGDFYGEWQGTRHFDGVAIIREDIEYAIECRLMLLANNPNIPMGDNVGYPMKIGDFGEYRIITTAVAGY